MRLKKLNSRPTAALHPAILLTLSYEISVTPPGLFVINLLHAQISGIGQNTANLVTKLTELKEKIRFSPQAEQKGKNDLSIGKYHPFLPQYSNIIEYNFSLHSFRNNVV